MAERILLSAVVVTAACLGAVAAEPDRVEPVHGEPTDGSPTDGAVDPAKVGQSGPVALSGAGQTPANETPTSETPATGTGTTNSTVTETVRGVVVRDRNGTVLLRALVRLNCTRLVVNATPDWRRYSLRLVYVREDDGRRAELYAGPLNGTVADPFGPTPYDLQQVGLRFAGLTVLSVSAPPRCPGSVAAVEPTAG